MTREQRLQALVQYLVGAVNTRGKRRITLLVDGESFGIAGIEELLNPRGPIPNPCHVRPPSGEASPSV